MLTGRIYFERRELNGLVGTVIKHRLIENASPYSFRELNEFLGLPIFLRNDGKVAVAGLFWTAIGNDYSEAINNAERIIATR